MLVPSGGYDLVILPEDDLTSTVVSGLTLQMRSIARRKWTTACSLKQIAEYEGLSVSKVKTRIHWIKEQVAQGVLM
jgi:DNA-directed RNA polymerase specialized sigma24 family protein